MANLTLYSRPECHLCEEAADLLREVEPGVDFEVVDIEPDLELLVRYSLQIPVLRRTRDGLELCWPFDADRLRAFLAS